MSKKAQKSTSARQQRTTITKTDTIDSQPQADEQHHPYQQEEKEAPERATTMTSGGGGGGDPEDEREKQVAAPVLQAALAPAHTQQQQQQQQQPAPPTSQQAAPVERKSRRSRAAASQRGLSTQSSDSSVITTNGSEQVDAAAAASHERKVAATRQQHQQQQVAQATINSTKASDGPPMAPRPNNQGQNICAGCARPIRERWLLLALDKHWHEDCLKCDCCDRLLAAAGASLYTHSGKLLCRDDFYRIFGQPGRCAACTRTIPPHEYVMRANDLAYHMDCFKCAQCARVFTIGELYHLTHDTHKIFCLRCHSTGQPPPKQPQQELPPATGDLSPHSQVGSQEQATTTTTTTATDILKSGQQLEQCERVEQQQQQQRQQQVASSEPPGRVDLVELTSQQVKRPPEQPPALPADASSAPACKKRLAVGGHQQEQACVM